MGEYVLKRDIDISVVLSINTLYHYKKMLQELEDTTIRLKYRLIQLGVELPPAALMTVSLLKQIDMDFKQMSQIIVGSHSPLLFANAETVLLQTTGQWQPIRNLNDLLQACSKAIVYIESY